MFKKIGIGVAALGAVAFGVYLHFLRPWQLRWGATDEEVAHRHQAKGFAPSGGD